MSKFKLGDIVTVVNSGMVFANYFDWLIPSPELQPLFQNGKLPREHTTGIITRIAPHTASPRDYNTLLGVKIDGQLFIIDARGVELVESTMDVDTFDVINPHSRIIHIALTRMLEELSCDLEWVKLDGLPMNALTEQIEEINRAIVYNTHSE